MNEFIARQIMDLLKRNEWFGITTQTFLDHGIEYASKSERSYLSVLDAYPEDTSKIFKMVFKNTIIYVFVNQKDELLQMWKVRSEKT